MARVKLVQVDGKLPNLALMKLAHWHRAQGDRIRLTRSVQPTLFDQEGSDVVYGSAIFTRSLPLVRELRALHPQAILGGTGSGRPLSLTVERTLGLPEYSYEKYDYSIYPRYPWSIGFTQRGCRMPCRFCVVPGKEGKPKAVNTIQDLWRPDTPRNIVLLDNDFFGQNQQEWQDRIKELKEGRFKVNFNQGINVRAITAQSAAAIASVQYYDHQFKKRRLHTAWDNLGNEKVFFRGVERLTAAGIKPQRLMVYMLVGFDEEETMEKVLYRYRKLTEHRCRVFPMVFQPWEGEEEEEDSPEPTKAHNTPEPHADPEEKERRRKFLQDLHRFQRWVIGRYSEFIPWEKFDEGGEHDRKARKMQEQMPSLFDFTDVGLTEGMEAEKQ